MISNIEQHCTKISTVLPLIKKILRFYILRLFLFRGSHKPLSEGAGQ